MHVTITAHQLGQLVDHITDGLDGSDPVTMTVVDGDRLRFTGSHTDLTIADDGVLFRATADLDLLEEDQGGVQTPARPRRTGIEDTASCEAAADLLRHVLRSTHVMKSSGMEPQTLSAYALSGVMAWSAYCYLDALHAADPELAATVTADLAGQLDSGELTDLARDAAQAAGHDPETWTQEAEDTTGGAR